MEYKDYYQLMGVARDASADEIKRAYRKLARKYHPDVSKEAGAEAKFKELGEAYDVLKDKEKRTAYDQYGKDWQQQQGAGFGGGFQGSQGGQKQYDDFFSEFFGGGFSQQTQPQRGKDVHSKLSVTLQDAYHGSTMTVQVGRRALKIKIPAGISQGQQIRLAGQGNDGSHGGQKGDLLVEIQLQPDPLYRLEQKNIIITLPLTPWEAALGASIMAPTLGGAVQIKIPAGSQSGHKLRLKGKGFPGQPAGDQVVELQVVLPLADNEQTKKLYEQMAKDCPFAPRAHIPM